MPTRFAGGVFRSNPAYQLVLADRLPSPERRRLAGLLDGAGAYGVLRPSAGGRRTVKVVDQRTALLWLTLVEPGPLPRYLARDLGERHDDAVRRLVLDGILEMEVDGVFVSGRAAAPALPDTLPTEVGTGALARLSVEALRHGQRLALADARELSARLYRYNRLPLTPEWLAAFPGAAQVESVVLGPDGSPRRRALERGWARLAPDVSGKGWLLWRSRHSRSPDTEAKPRFKLYVSPVPGHEGEAVAAVVARSDQATHFKVGDDAYGLLRPDKIVAYFTGFEDLGEAAERMEADLRGCPAHGVPFTAELRGDGLLSWGWDPPRHPSARAWRGTESWRFWLTNQLASALLAPEPCRDGSVEPWRFALARVALEGVDVRTWEPAPALRSGDADRDGA